MENNLIKDALWIAHTLFMRGSATGSSANLSFRLEDKIYISGSGTCFGTLTEEQFACLRLDGVPQNDVRPSKEFPLHQVIYQTKPQIHAVIHTHSRYAVLYSCLKQEDVTDIMPSYTPYLKMKVGKIGLIPYFPPGSQELFEAVKNQAKDSDGYILKQHGPVIPGVSLMDAFYGMEEMEESARIAWELTTDKKLDICEC